MRIFALSDVHIDYSVNRAWLLGLSNSDFQQDILILAGDLSDDLSLLEACFKSLVKKFRKVCFVPGNHELWIRNSGQHIDSFDKFDLVIALAEETGIHTRPVSINSVSIVPLFSWYDFSFGQPDTKLQDEWMDFRLCRWSNISDMSMVCQWMLDKNALALQTVNETIISFSHFLPRIDVIPAYLPRRYRYLFPVFGSYLLERQIRRLKPQIHVYGHSHLNRHVLIDSITYVNNAFGYPSETRIARKELRLLYEVDSH